MIDHYRTRSYCKTHPVLLTSSPGGDPSNHFFSTRISGNRIVWNSAQDCTHTPMPCHDIFSYDLKTDTKQQITAELKDQTNPDVSGNRIVWQDNRNGDHYYWEADIYMAELE